jgi:hypothetical protein
VGTARKAGRLFCFDHRVVAGLDERESSAVERVAALDAADATSRSQNGCRVQTLDACETSARHLVRYIAVQIVRIVRARLDLTSLLKPEEAVPLVWERTSRTSALLSSGSFQRRRYLSYILLSHFHHRMATFLHAVTLGTIFLLGIFTLLAAGELLSLYHDHLSSPSSFLR